MKFFLDTANLNDIREAASFGFADGVTTNPSLIAKEGDVDFKQHIAAICEIVQGPVSAEVTSQDKEGMVREGLEYSKIAPNVVVKCPSTREGLKATRQLSDQGIKVNVTLCFSAAQAILAAKAGASFISPFLGRLDDIGENGLNPASGHRRDLPQLQLENRGAGGESASPDSRDRSSATRS